MRIKWKKKVHPARISCVSKKEPSATESKSKSKPNHHIYRNIKYTSRQMALCCNSTPNLIHKFVKIRVNILLQLRCWNSDSLRFMCLGAVSTHKTLKHLPLCWLLAWILPKMKVTFRRCEGDVFIMNVMRISLLYFASSPSLSLKSRALIHAHSYIFLRTRDPFHKRKKSFIQTNKKV